MSKKGKTCGGPSKVQQSHKNMCDINYLIKRYRRVEEMPKYHKRPMYGDFSKVTDYQEAIEVTERAAEQFKTLPSELRKKFDSNPSKFLAFIDDEANKEELIKLGFLKNPDCAEDYIEEEKEEETGQPSSPAPPNTEEKPT